MDGFSFLSCFFFLFLGSASLSHAGGGIAHMDEYWKERTETARKAARAAYNPNPFNITSNFNADVHSSLESNSTRRALRGRHRLPSQCLATNPIDRCWRCRKNWANHRKLLASCAKGFGHRATGGAAGKFYVVTDPRDDSLMNPRPGTLRWGAIQVRPLWIIFARDMVIRLSEELLVQSHKTIDGRGHNIRIVGGAGITLQLVHNVIIHGIHVHDIHPSNGGIIRDSPTHFGERTHNDGDGISLYTAHDIWIDHVSMSKCGDGLIDAIQESTAITISNCHFTNHNEVMLLGASDAHWQDQFMQVTVAFNHFGQNLVQRMPRCRWGFIHVVNNDYTHWLMYAIGGSSHPTIISQGNRYVAPNQPDAKEVTHRDYAPTEEWMKWTWISQGDVMQNGAFFTQAHGKNSKMFSRQDMIRAKPGNYVRRLTRYAGALNCVPGKPC